MSATARSIETDAGMISAGAQASTRPRARAVTTAAGAGNGHPTANESPISRPVHGSGSAADAMRRRGAHAIGSSPVIRTSRRDAGAELGAVIHFLTERFCPGLSKADVLETVERALTDLQGSVHPADLAEMSFRLADFRLAALVADRSRLCDTASDAAAVTGGPAPHLGSQGTREGL